MDRTLGDLEPGDEVYVLQDGNWKVYEYVGASNYLLTAISREGEKFSAYILPEAPLMYLQDHKTFITPDINYKLFYENFWRLGAGG